MTLTIHTLWSPGSYGDRARHQILPDSTPIFVPTNSDIVNAVIKNNGVGIIPVSNPYGGSVNESWEALEKQRKYIIIAGSHTLPLDHAIVQRAEHVWNEVHRIFSHPQAYHQSKPALDKMYPIHEFVESKSTIGALNMITDQHHVAICSAAAVRGNPELTSTYSVIRENISPADNATKFVVIATRDSVKRVAQLPPSDIDILRVTLSDRKFQLSVKTALVNLAWGNIHEWGNIKTTPGISPLYSFLMITSRLGRWLLEQLLIKAWNLQPITQKEDSL